MFYVLYLYCYILYLYFHILYYIFIFTVIWKTKMAQFWKTFFSTHEKASKLNKCIYQNLYFKLKRNTLTHFCIYIYIYLYIYTFYYIVLVLWFNFCQSDIFWINLKYIFLVLHVKKKVFNSIPSLDHLTTLL